MDIKDLLVRLFTILIDVSTFDPLFKFNVFPFIYSTQTLNVERLWLYDKEMIQKSTFELVREKYKKAQGEKLKEKRKRTKTTNRSL
jgi:hypothetical protein